MRSETDRIRSQLRDFFQGRPVLKAEFFGLCARNPIPLGASIELLVTPASGAERYQLFQMEGELEEILGRRVSILLRPGVEAMAHRPARDLILDNALAVYNAATDGKDEVDEPVTFSLGALPRQLRDRPAPSGTRR